VIVWRLTFSKLSGRAVAAHIHSGARGEGRTGDRAALRTVPQRRARPCDRRRVLLNALESGASYVNVHTKKNPGRRDPRASFPRYR
jgi:hypothetical protein